LPSRQREGAQRHTWRPGQSTIDPEPEYSRDTRSTRYGGRHRAGSVARHGSDVMDYSLPTVHAWHNRLSVQAVVSLLQADYPGSLLSGLNLGTTTSSSTPASGGGGSSGGLPKGAASLIGTVATSYQHPPVRSCNQSSAIIARSLRAELPICAVTHAPSSSPTLASRHIIPSL
jgi:hypothetical protein